MRLQSILLRWQFHLLKALIIKNDLLFMIYVIMNKGRRFIPVTLLEQNCYLIIFIVTVIIGHNDLFISL